MAASGIPSTETFGSTVITRHPATRGYCEFAIVNATLPSGRVVEFMVYGPRPAFGELTGPEVNWSALGSVSANDAAAFATYLSYCATVVAPSLSGPEGH